MCKYPYGYKKLVLGTSTLEYVPTSRYLPPTNRTRCKWPRREGSRPNLAKQLHTPPRIMFLNTYDHRNKHFERKKYQCTPCSNTDADADEEAPVVHGVRQGVLGNVLADAGNKLADDVDAMAITAAQLAFDPAALNRHIANCARAVCGVDRLRPMQAQVALEVLRPDTPNHVVVVQRTGSGKTLLMRVVGLMLRGVVVIFVPLHALTADVMAKFSEASQQWGAVQAFNLDELSDNAKNVYLDLLESIRQMHARTTTTTFAFMSPQFLLHHREALDVLLGAATSRVLRLVVLDEIHVRVQSMARPSAT